METTMPVSNKIFNLLGGRKFIGVILATILTFTSVIWTYSQVELVPEYNVINNESVITGWEVAESAQGWSFITVLLPSYFLYLTAYAGLNIVQRKNENEVTSPE